MSKKESITVTALDRSRTFRDRGALAEHVAEILEHRGGIFDPLELRAIAELARLNGAEMPDVKRIARATAFHSPERPQKGPTPLDSRIAARTERVAELKAAMAAAEDRWRGRADELEREYRRRLARARGDRRKIRAAQEWAGAHQGEVAILREEFFAAEAAWKRAHAGLNALRAAAERWRHDQLPRFHNHEDPSKPLTLAELHERRERRDK